MNLKEFGEYFSSLRKREEYKSQRDLADKSGVSNATISRIESGANRVTTEVLRELANCFVTVTYEELMQKAGYLDLETVVNETNLDNQIFEVQLQIDIIGNKIALAQIYSRHNSLVRFFESKQISIDVISENINASPLDLLAMFEMRLPIPFDLALKLTRFYRFSFAKMFIIKKAFIISNLNYDEAEVLENIDELLHEEFVLNVEKINRNSIAEATTTIESDQYKFPNLSLNEFEFLLEQLNIYRKLKLKRST